MVSIVVLNLRNVKLKSRRRATVVLRPSGAATAKTAATRRAAWGSSSATHATHAAEILSNKVE